MPPGVLHDEGWMNLLRTSARSRHLYHIIFLSIIWLNMVFLHTWKQLELQALKFCKLSYNHIFLWWQVHKEKASLGTNCCCLKKSQRISTCCHWEKLCTLRREDRKRESIVFCRWDVFECVWTENGGARKHRICGAFWNALSRAVACFMLLMAFWCPPSNNLHKLPQSFITSFSESHQHLRADTRKFTKSTWDKTIKPWPRPPDQYQFSNMGLGGERQGWRLEPDQPETEPLNPEPWPRSTWDKTLKPWTLTLTTWSVPGFEDGHGRIKTGMEVRTRSTWDKTLKP